MSFIGINLAVNQVPSVKAQSRACTRLLVRKGTHLSFAIMARPCARTFELSSSSMRSAKWYCSASSSLPFSWYSRISTTMDE
jgi:hypothetical protein